MKKEFGKLSKNEIKEIFAIDYQGQQEKVGLDDLLKDTDNERIRNILIHTFPWSYLYEFPFSHILIIFIYSVTTKTQRKKIFRSHDPVAALIKWANSDAKPPRFTNKWGYEEVGIFLSIVMAIQQNIASVKMFGVFLNDLIASARTGDDTALFDAVLVDSSAINSFTIGKRISLAVLHNDAKFFDSLSKAIKKTRPRRPAREHDELRLMASILEESVGLKNITRNKAYKLLVDDLQLYPDGGKDSMKGFEKFIERLLKKKADMKE